MLDLSFLRTEHLAVVFEFAVLSVCGEALLVDFFGVAVLVGDVVVMMVVPSPFVLTVLVPGLFEVDRVSSSEDVESYLTRLYLFFEFSNSRNGFARFIYSENHW